MIYNLVPPNIPFLDSIGTLRKPTLFIRYNPDSYMTDLPNDSIIKKEHKSYCHVYRTRYIHSYQFLRVIYLLFYDDYDETNTEITTVPSENKADINNLISYFCTYIIIEIIQ